MTVNSFITLSLSPLLVAFTVVHTARIKALIKATGGFVVNILAADQIDLARWFANRDRPAGAESFAGIAIAGAPSTGGVLIGDVIGHFTCENNEFVDAGDHSIVIGSVMECDVMGHGPQLLFTDGVFRPLQFPPAQ
jgi:flavin reductase (DIM6/NTAB) family NADH-FMN oxidoreductase RutF